MSMSEDAPLDIRTSSERDNSGSSSYHSSYHRHNTELPDSNLPSEDELERFDKRYGTAANVAHIVPAREATYSPPTGSIGAAGGLGRATALQRAREQQLQLLQLRVEHAQRQKEQRREMRHLEYEKKVEAKTAHRFPPVGTVALCGCGISTIALNYPNTGHFAQNPSIPAMQICFAGITQLMVAILEWINGATVMYSIFSTFAAFHLTVGLMLIMPYDAKYSDVQVGFYATRGYQPVLAPVTGYLLGVYLLLFAIWAFVCLSVMPLSTIASNVLLLAVFFIFLPQAIANMIDYKPLLHAGAYFGIISGGGMMYIGLAETINFVYGRELVPLIAWNRIPGCINYRAMQRKRQAVREQERRLVELQAQQAEAQGVPPPPGPGDAPAKPRIKKLMRLETKKDSYFS